MNLGELSFDELYDLNQDIDGWLTKNEARLLYDTTCKLNGAGAIVEIGSWCGKSLMFLVAGALKSQNTCKKISIDPFVNSKDEPNGMYDVFVNNLKKLNIWDNVTHIKEKSQVAGSNFKEKIELIFIDGFHKYEAVKKDYELFFPNLVDGGFVLFHDVISYTGPFTLVKELAKNDDKFKILRYEDNCLLAQKVIKLTAEDKLNNKTNIDLIENFIKLNGLRLQE